jgi:hypothetical protein
MRKLGDLRLYISNIADVKPHLSPTTSGLFIQHIDPGKAQLQPVHLDSSENRKKPTNQFQ